MNHRQIVDSCKLATICSQLGYNLSPTLNPTSSNSVVRNQRTTQIETSAKIGQLIYLPIF